MRSQTFRIHSEAFHNSELILLLLVGLFDYIFQSYSLKYSKIIYTLKYFCQKSFVSWKRKDHEVSTLHKGLQASKNCWAGEIVLPREQHVNWLILNASPKNIYIPLYVYLKIHLLNQKLWYIVGQLSMT